MTERKRNVSAKVTKLYRKTTEIIASFQWSLFFKIKHLSSPLSERFKSTIQYLGAVLPMDFLSILQNRFNEIVLRSSISKKTKRVPLYLNFRKRWLIPRSPKTLWIDKKRNKHEYEILKKLLAKKIFKYIFKSLRKPNLKSDAMLLDSKYALP